MLIPRKERPNQKHKLRLHLIQHKKVYKKNSTIRRWRTVC